LKRTTIQLPDDLDARLREEAKRRGTTIAEVTRTALEEHLAVDARRGVGAAGATRSGQSDFSERIDEIMAAEADRPH
jgi:predicted DNA-binding protein